MGGGSILVSMTESGNNVSEAGRLAREVWGRAGPVTGSPAEKYLAHRGIGAIEVARYQAQAVIYEGSRQLTLPALILPIEDDTGLIALQRIFLQASTGEISRKVPGGKRIFDKLRGGAIRLGAAPGDTLHLAREFEDAASVMVLHNLDHCWAVCAHARYGLIDIPASVRSITIWTRQETQEAEAIAQARTALTSNDRTLDIRPPLQGQCWNDVLLQQAPQIARQTTKPQRAARAAPSSPESKRKAATTTPANCADGNREAFTIETSGGTLWAHLYHDTGRLRLWWPPNEDLYELLKPILKGRAQWHREHKAWYASDEHAAVLIEELEQA